MDSSNRFSHKWWALIGLSLLSFTAFLDYTIVSTALPFIQKALHASILQLQWVMNIFGMILCMIMIVVGKLGDMYGRRKVYYIGFIIFFIAAIGAGLSNSIDGLIFFRGIQGFAGAIIFTLGVAILPQAFPESQQTTAVGVFSAFNGAGLAIGPFLGGLLIQYLNWRWVFFINLPIILIGFALCSFSLKESVKTPNIKIDWIGFVLLAGGLAFLINGIIHGSQTNWGGTLSPTLMIIGIIGLIALFISEKRSKHPLLDFSIFKNPHALLALLTCISASLVTFVLFFFDPIYLAVIKNESAVVIGIALLAVPLVQVVVSLTLTPLVKTFGIVNLLVLGALTGAAAGVMHAHFAMHSSWFYIIIAFVLMGYTWGIANAGSITALIQSVPGEKIGASIGTTFTFWNLFGAIFLAIATALFHQISLEHMARVLRYHQIKLTLAQHGEVTKALAQPEHAKSLLHGFIGSNAHTVFQDFYHSFLSGFHVAAWFSAILMFLGFLIALRLKFKSH